MNIYLETIYPVSSENEYPQKFSNYLVHRFFNKEGATLLDVGYGSGKYMQGFSLRGLKCYGVDKRKSLVEGLSDDQFKECDIENSDIPFESDSFDYVFSKSVIEHVNNADNFFNNVKRILKPNGLCVIMTPDWNSQMGNFWDDYTHVHAYSRKSLRDALLIHGFKDVDCEYFYQLPFVWEYPFLNFVPKIISILPDFLKWKDREERNGRDRKLIRFSKEKMLLSYGVKE